MQLKNQVEWALHCCAVLATVPEGGHLSSKALAEFHGVPKEYLSKALQALSLAGLVESTLGPTGGYRLARAPKKISFLDIVEAVEGKASTFVCTEIRGNNPCLPKNHCNRGACAIARVMWDADQAWRAKLQKVNIADVGAMLEQEVPKEILAKTFAWVGERS